MRSGKLKLIFGSNFGSESLRQYFVCIVKLHFIHNAALRLTEKN